ncbi:glycosyl hydrolase family 18 protein [Actinomycetospora lutea]|uniref:glycosyl hydrolase family 18 protein n=1 Tax=Actinomycetospora lutea TaxID=663604 RepID=UPI002367022A|nr:glycosyl hydrolase family 18 protein [Actinomycetospora lutea]MDD7941991.1 glycosyl hydrolase family 18 protein [Actinomycetospora lutea]
MSSPRRPFLAASLPPDALASATRLVIEHADVIDEVSPCLYGVGPDDTVDLLAAPSAATAAIETLRAASLPILPGVTDRYGDERTETVARMVHDGARIARHVRAVVDLVRRHGFAGLEVDYVTLRPGDRAAFSAYVAELARALHEVGARLAVTVEARTDAQDDDEHDAAHDYRALGAVVDELRLRAVDYHWDTTPPGPIAPVEWVRAVLAYATAVVAQDKIVLGLATTGYHWTDDHGSTVAHHDALVLADRLSAGEVRWDPLSAAPWITRRDPDGTVHEVWFEDARSLAAKSRLAAEAGVDAILLWLSAPPDPRVWAEFAAPADSTG